MAPLPILTHLQTNCIYNNGGLRSGQGCDQSVEASRVASALVDLDIKVTFVDDRYDYGEVRYRAYGFIDGVAYSLAFTTQNGLVRPISLRRAHMKEMRRYVP